MAANTVPIFAKAPNLTEVTIVTAGGTTAVVVFTAGADGSKLTAILAVSDDTAAKTCQVFIHDGTTAFLIGTKVVPTLSGTNGSAPTINLLDAALIPGLDMDNGIFLPTGYTVRVGVTVAMTAAKTLTLVGIGVNY